MITHASLFSGIGACDLAAEELGWRNVFNCEINPFCRRVLNYHFPDVDGYEDIKTTDFRKYEGQVKVLTGGFPCQGFSIAGLRKGAEDDRYLWPQMYRAITEIKPSYVLGENVVGILSMVSPYDEPTVEGKASLFDEGEEILESRATYITEDIRRDLEREGYALQVFLLPACAVGAPHRRDRVWFLAKRIGRDPRGGDSEKSMFSILPTPTASEFQHRRRVEELKEKGANSIYQRINGALRPNGLADFLQFILPTPTSRDWKGAEACEYKRQRGEKTDIRAYSLPGQFLSQPQDGKVFQQLNPLFVEEMMGFPRNWILTPFLSQDGGQSH